MKKSIRFNAILNTLKQILTVLFPVITVPYITRVLLPENYGRINTGNSIISYISLVAGLGISSYAIREGSLLRRDRKKLDEFSSQVFSVNLMSTALSYLILAAIVFLIPHYYEYRLLLAVQGCTVLFTTLGADWINTIEEDFLYITVRYIIFHVLALIMMFVFVRKPEDYYIYALITLFASAGANIMNIFYIRKYVSIRFTFGIDWKKHLLPILILFGNSIAMTIYVNSDITILELFKGPFEVGIYSISAKIYTIIKHIFAAVLTVSIPRLTECIGMHDSTQFETLGKRLYNALFTLMCPVIVGVIMFRREAIMAAGGTGYAGAENSLLILMLASAFAMTASFYSWCILMPLKEEKKILLGTVISAFLNIILNLVFIPLFGGAGAAVTTLISELFVAVFFAGISAGYGFHFLSLRTAVLSLLGSSIVAAVCFISKKVLDGLLPCFTAAFFLSAAVYLLIQIIGKNEAVLELSGIFRKRQ